MKLDQLIKVQANSKKRVGRGVGSGKGKTAGRGTKGQKARGNVPTGFIGGTLPLYRRLPYRRGLGNAKQSVKAIAVSLSKLAIFDNGLEISLQNLVEKGIINDKEAKKHGVKIVNNGEINKALTIKLPISAAAAEKVEKAGGKIVRV